MLRVSAIISVLLGVQLLFWIRRVQCFPLYSQAVALISDLQVVQRGSDVIKDHARWVTEEPIGVKSIRDHITPSNEKTHMQDFVRKSILYCGHHLCMTGTPFYDSSHDLCLCSTGPIDLNEPIGVEGRLHPDAKCKENTQCSYPYLPSLDPASHNCVCSLLSFFVELSPTHLKFRAPCKDNYEDRLNELDRSTAGVSDGTGFLCTIETDVLDTKTFTGTGVRRRQDITIPGAVSLPPLPTFVPPPKTDITPELIQQSLTVEPQIDAIVHSVIPYFADGVITFHVQLDGPIPQTLQLNATDSMPCDSVGTHPDPNLVLVPRSVHDGHQQVSIPGCLIIAVNKYNASWINYWVQKTDGSGAMFSLLGNAKVHDIDQLDSSKPASLQIRVASTDNNSKRVTTMHRNTAGLKRYQVSKSATDKAHVADRGLEAISPYTAVMTADTCASITCVNNGNKAAIFNPFNKAC